jgi:ribosomal protein L11 methyltransferase
MSWIQATFELTAADAEAVADALLQRGAFSVDIADADSGTARERALFGEPGAQPGVWPKQRVSALFDSRSDVAVLIGEVLRSLELASGPAISLETLEEQDWVRATQQQFEPLKISDRLWIVPSWCEPPDRMAINLRLDPGLAFGTGSHPTTRQCLTWLEAQLVPGCTLLDYGCGSGVLAVVSKKLGAGAVVAVDIDPAAVRATQINARLNQVEVDARDPDAVPAGPYQIVVANILSNPLKVLAPLLARYTAPGGTIVLAGVLTGQADEVAGTYRTWFDMQIWSQCEGWACLTGSRRS